MVRAGLSRSGSAGHRRKSGREDEREDRVIGTLELPLLEQGSVQFMLLVVMILVVCAIFWITISK
jgi:hypothetical protein